MKILLDECLPKKLKNDLNNFDVKTVLQMGWAGKKNGELLNLAERDFDVFVTSDQNLQYQQKLKDRSITIIVLKASNSRYETLKPLVLLIPDKLYPKSISNIIEIGEKDRKLRVVSSFLCKFFFKTWARLVFLCKLLFLIWKTGPPIAKLRSLSLCLCA